MARRGWLVVVIGRLDPLGIFFSLSGRHLCNIIKLWRMGTVPQFSCKKNQLRWGRKHFLKLGRKKSCQNISSTSFVWSKKSIINEFTFDFTYFFLQKKGTSKNCTNIYSHLSIILGTSLQQFFGDQYIHILCWPTPHTAPYILANHAKWYLCWNDPKNSRIYDAI